MLAKSQKAFLQSHNLPHFTPIVACAQVHNWRASGNTPVVGSAFVPSGASGSTFRVVFTVK